MVIQISRIEIGYKLVTLKVFHLVGTLGDKLRVYYSIYFLYLFIVRMNNLDIIMDGYEYFIVIIDFLK